MSERMSEEMLIREILKYNGQSTVRVISRQNTSHQIKGKSLIHRLCCTSLYAYRDFRTNEMSVSLNSLRNISTKSKILNYEWVIVLFILSTHTHTKKFNEQEKQK